MKSVDERGGRKALQWKRRTPGTSLEQDNKLIFQEKEKRQILRKKKNRGCRHTLKKGNLQNKITNVIYASSKGE